MQNILLLHGALGSAGDLEPLAAALRGQGSSVHSLSFSGHGGAAFQPAFGIGQFAAELEQYILEKGLEQAAVFGYSMGGFVALQLAAQRPGLLGRIVTLGTKFNWSKEAVEKETKLLNPAIMSEKVPAFAKLLESRHGANWTDMVTRTAGLMREISDRQFLAPDILKDITIPVLLGLGDKDQMVTLDETLGVYKTLPNANMYMLPATKHQVETADVSLLSHIITRFLARS